SLSTINKVALYIISASSYSAIATRLTGDIHVEVRRRRRLSAAPIYKRKRKDEEVIGDSAWTCGEKGTR
ncbi:hypothetical protein PFISCL1PPCAC_25948, partial [Pristionchus fissidentatus]